MNAVPRNSLQPEDCISLILIILLAIFVLLGRILKIKCLHTKYCFIRIIVFPESCSPLPMYSEAHQHDSSEFSLLLFKNSNTGGSVLRFNSQDL